MIKPCGLFVYDWAISVGVAVDADSGVEQSSAIQCCDGAIGVTDDAFGNRLKAATVLTTGTHPQTIAVWATVDPTSILVPVMANPLSEVLVDADGRVIGLGAIVVAGVVGPTGTYNLTGKLFFEVRNYQNVGL